LLVGMRDKRYDESVAAVETAERQLLASPDTAKKRPSGVSKNQRRSSVA